MFKITFQKDIIRKVIIVKWFYTWFLQSGRKMFILQKVMIQRVKTRKWDSSSKCNGLIQKMILGPDIRRIGKVRNHQCYILLFREKRVIRDDRRRNTSSQIDRADCLEGNVTFLCVDITSWFVQANITLYRVFAHSLL